MTYSFKVFFQIDSEIPGDSGKRSKIVHVDAENFDDACEYMYYKYANDSEYDGYESLAETNDMMCDLFGHEAKEFEL